MESTQAVEVFDTLKKSIALYGVISAIVLGTVAALAALGDPGTPFMWIRSVLLLAVSWPLHRMAVGASEGSRRAYERLRTLTVVLPVAIVAVDLIPGVCPAWFAVMQGLSALALVYGACLTRGSGARAAFPKSA
ncbi:hypothetical protein ACQB60_39775 [Actinomycetota bacterium Odt1-20B]